MPEQAIICDESVTSGRNLFQFTRTVPQHDYLQLTGGAIGEGLPMAVGAAIACPDRKVISLEADGSGMYTLQALWTQAREALDVVTIVFANRSYAILHARTARRRRRRARRQCQAHARSGSAGPAVDPARGRHGRGSRARDHRGRILQGC